MRIIEGLSCVEEGAQVLASRIPQFAYALEYTGELPLRRKPDGFAALLNAIVGQQVSTASADAIWARLCAAGLNDENAMRAASDEDLRGCGLSRQKIRYARALAEADLDYAGFRTMASGDVVCALTQVSGIGSWTAEIYVMFSLGHADVFASGDLALQEATRVLFELEARPSEKQMRALAEEWSPWQSVAARILWAYYRVIKSREGIR